MKMVGRDRKRSVILRLSNKERKHSALALKSAREPALFQSFK